MIIYELDFKYRLVPIYISNIVSGFEVPNTNGRLISEPIFSI